MIDWGQIETKEDKFLKKKEAKHNEIATARYNQAAGGYHFTINNESYVVDSDGDARTAINGQITYCQLHPEETVQWKMQGGKFMEFSAEEFIALANDICMWIKSLFAKEAVIQAQIEAAQSEEELAAIKWDLEYGA